MMGLRGFIEKLLFGGERLSCPFCGTTGARKTSDGRIHCKSQSCPNFDPIFARSGRPVSLAPVPTSGRFQPAVPLTIQYKNCAGQDRTFVVEKDSVVRKRNHLVAKVAPRGVNIALSRDRIQNLAEVEAQIPESAKPSQPWPSARERQVLAYHKKHRSTSPLFEKVRAKYPNL
jgi:hypothetical protein